MAVVRPICKHAVPVKAGFSKKISCLENLAAFQYLLFTLLSNELTPNTFTNDVMEHILDHDDRKEIESKFSLHKYELSENVQ